MAIWKPASPPGRHEAAHVAAHLREIKNTDALTALYPLIEQLGRDINPALYSRAELRKRIDDGNGFILRVLEQPKLWLIGDESDVERV